MVALIENRRDDYYFDSVALNLHGFYGGLERIFELIAATIDNARPQGENWRQALLQQMSTEVVGLRPAVISEGALRRLVDYRGFRHIARNVYAHNFEADRLQKLVAGLPDILAQVQAELQAFADFLEQGTEK